ncbi:MAG TPA: ribosome-associated translation inhibitor RaiA [Acidimicrobiales bacterium]|nr:ribosome-associated translation inhibitor RaiA [Acidimicrobiales bacterium]
MEITVGGRKVEVSRPVRDAVEEKVGRLGRFLDGMERADVVFTEERNPRISEKEVCEVTLYGHGHVVRARAAASETLAALDLVVAKLTHRLEKLKGKLVGRSHPRRHGSASHLTTAATLIDGSDVVIPDVESSGKDREGGGHEDPRIVRSKQFAIKPMTPEEAALQMELLGHDFFLFTNADTSGAAVVYRRKDGDVGLIEGS